MENKARENNNDHRISPMTILVLLALLVVIIAVLAVNTSCSQQKTGTGYVRFSQDTSRDLTASIGYPDVNSLLWDITAVKLSSGSTVGQGTSEGVLLTDEFGPFSTGRWEFSLEGRDGDEAVYRGSTTAQIGEGSNLLEVSVSPAGESGTLVFSGCNIPHDNGTALYSGLYIFIDGERVYGAGTQYLTEGTGVWLVPEQTFGLSAGLHDVEVIYNGNEPLAAHTFKVRIEGGLTTTVTFGKFEGTAGLVVTVDESEAIAE